MPLRFLLVRADISVRETVSRGEGEDLVPTPPWNVDDRCDDGSGGRSFGEEVGVAGREPRWAWEVASALPFHWAEGETAEIGKYDRIFIRKLSLKPKLTNEREEVGAHWWERLAETGGLLVRIAGHDLSSSN